MPELFDQGGDALGRAARLMLEYLARQYVADPTDDNLQRAADSLRKPWALLLARWRLANVVAGMVDSWNDLPLDLSADRQKALEVLAGQLSFNSEAEAQRLLLTFKPEEQVIVAPLLVAPPKEIAEDNLPEPGAPLDKVRFPSYEDQLQALSERRLVTREEWDELERDELAGAFTVAGLEADDAMERVRQALITTHREGLNLKEFKEVAGAGNFLSDAHACFLPGTLVEGDILAASKARYFGPAVEIETHAGCRLRVTINHPILTPSGWKSAGQLQEGEELISYGNSIESLNRAIVSTKRMAADNQQIPACIEDVFQTILGQSPTWFNVARPISALNFYGDAAFMNGKVDCVRADGMLTTSTNANRIKFCSKVGFMERNITSAIPSIHCQSLFNPFVKRFFSPNSSSMKILQPFNFGRWRKPTPINSLPIGATANLDPALFHATEKRTAGDMQLSRKLLSAFPGLITSDRIIKINRIEWAGHVYDLQTKTGFIVAQGVICGNSTVYRTNLHSSYSDGRLAVVQNPHVRDAFPYASYDPIHDDRTRPTHLLLARSGLDGSNVYYIDDPVFETFRPPWEWGCRCSWGPLTVMQAASKGVKEAQRWLQTGMPPRFHQAVPWPTFEGAPLEPDPRYRRAAA